MKQFSLLTLLLILTMACTNAAPETVPTAVPTTTPPTEPTPLPPTPTPEPNDPFRVIAYVTGNIIPQTIPYERLTHINYSFLIPNADGTFARLANGWKLKQIVKDAHAADVKVLISVGGWGWEKEFEALAADPATRAAFVNNLKEFVIEYDLDGSDVDWEYPLPGESAANYLALMTEIEAAMPDKLLTTAVVSHGSNAEGIPDATFELFDFLNVMTYDGPQHGTMAQFDTGLDYWLERGVPPEKIVMGIPFYARPSQIAYSKLIESEPDAAYNDSAEINGTLQLYSGIPSTQQKTVQSMAEAGGIMFWTLDHDTAGDLSLLKAIDDIVKTHNSE